DPSPRYHAREVALKLAEGTGAVVVLGSATPDVTSYYRSTRGEFKLLELPSRIVTNGGRAAAGRDRAREETHLPGVQIVDLRVELREGNRSIFSRDLSEAMGVALNSQEQVILFINRRGAATFAQCRDCGHTLRCRRCDVALTYHSAWERMVCHHCGYNAARPRACPNCKSGSISYLGLGTQRVEEEVAKTFPGARVLRWDRDVTGRKQSHEEILQKFLSHEADVLIGTQMIAKGLHMPRVTLVGVISADVGINLPDFRAGERVFQVLSQVSGRAGRGPLGGKVIVQTFNPNHYAVAAAARHDYAGFYRQEIAYRRRHGYPPFNGLARLVYSHTSISYARNEARRVAKLLRRESDSQGAPDTDILGPVPCYIPRVRGRYRWQILVRTPEPASFLKDTSVPDRWTLDIDPVTLL
ncbi:MAG: primosomal protein N', partial [Dehalococcoidia bacterium]